MSSNFAFPLSPMLVHSFRNPFVINPFQAKKKVFIMNSLSLH
jgi:hypothetical protein